MSFLLPNALRLAREAPSPSRRKDATRAEANKSDNRTTVSSRGPEILWLAVFEVGHDGGLLETATDENDDVDGQDRSNFDETRRPEGADAALNLLFYWTEETTTTKERVLQQLGLLRGAAAFCSSMTETPESQSSDRLQRASLRSQKRRSVLIQTESATYLAACFSVPRHYKRHDSGSGRWIYDDDWREDGDLQRRLRSSWEEWQNQHGSQAPSTAAADGRTERSERALERFYSRWISQWKQDCVQTSRLSVRDLVGRSSQVTRACQGRWKKSVEVIESAIGRDYSFARPGGGTAVSKETLSQAYLYDGRTLVTALATEEAGLADDLFRSVEQLSAGSSSAADQPVESATRSRQWLAGLAGLNWSRDKQPSSDDKIQALNSKQLQLVISKCGPATILMVFEPSQRMEASTEREEDLYEALSATVTAAIDASDEESNLLAFTSPTAPNASLTAEQPCSAEAALPDNLLAATVRLIACHRDVLGSLGVEEAMSRTSDGAVWLRSWRPTQAVCKHAAILDGSCSMIDAEKRVMASK